MVARPVEVVRDKALALPPLDLQLADDLIAQTRISRLLGPYRNVPGANRSAVARALVRLAQMSVELPAIRELDINPLLVDEQGLLPLMLACRSIQRQCWRWCMTIRGWLYGPIRRIGYAN
jgi:hypothetical protein